MRSNDRHRRPDTIASRRPRRGHLQGRLARPAIGVKKTYRPLGAARHAARRAPRAKREGSVYAEPSRHESIDNLTRLMSTSAELRRSLKNANASNLLPSQTAACSTGCTPLKL
jgi:hypothetical protein